MKKPLTINKGDLDGNFEVKIDVDNLAPRFICPDCGEEHNADHHPPYCTECIRWITGTL